MPEFFKSPAIVITARDMGESDRLVTFFTLTGGKVRGVAKGAKRSRHRFVNALEPFTFLRLCLVPSRTNGLGRVDSVEIEESFPLLRHQVNAYGMASLCCELVDLWTREGDTHRELFSLLLWLLHSLKDVSSTKKTTLIFKTKLLALSGFGPDWENCLLCKEPLAGKNGGIWVHEGGFACGACRKTAVKVPAITLGVLRSLGHMQNRPVRELDRLSISEPTLTAAWSLMQRLHCHHLQRTPASYKVLSELS
jgi:DNA repair protein RecO (recombination protein O)